MPRRQNGPLHTIAKRAVTISRIINQPMLFLLVTPDILPLIIAKNIELNGFHMPIDKDAVVVTVMAL